MSPYFIIKSKVNFHLKGIKEVPPSEFDLIVCLNFLRYLTDKDYAGGLPSVNEASESLYRANKPYGVLLIDPKTTKSRVVHDALIAQGYLTLSKNAYY